jgi:hypothetical protein
MMTFRAATRRELEVGEPSRGRVTLEQFGNAEGQSADASFSGYCGRLLRNDWRTQMRVTVQKVFSQVNFEGKGDRRSEKSRPIGQNSNYGNSL